MGSKKRILLKLTGKIFSSDTGEILSAQTIKKLASQIKKLQPTHLFSLVVGGGNILRGAELQKKNDLDPNISHQAGMLATMINGLFLKGILDTHSLQTELLSSFVCPQIANNISTDSIANALQQEKVIIFTGGTGVPYFTTDTNAVLRSLQINAKEIWKGTDVDGIYTSDPHTNKNATRIKKITYDDTIKKKLGIMDQTAYSLAQKHAKVIRICNIFEKDALINMAENQDFGSTITVK